MYALQLSNQQIRIIIGFGSSGRTLAYSWVSTAIPRDQQRTTLTIMSMTRSVGMILGPLINTLVAKVSFNFLGVIPINPYNVAGLILAFGETILFIATAIFLIDPPTKIDTAGLTTTKNDTPKKKKNVGWKDITTALTDFDLFLPMMNLFCLMCNFTFYQVAIPPVASNAFHWSPVTISTVLAAQAVILFIGMVTSMLLSMTKVADITMIIGGNLCFVIGGIMTYYTWTSEAESWQFVAPIMIVSLAYPFIGPANRSKYTRAVHDRPELEGSHGVMQSLFNQSFMVGGFIAPNFVTAFILRTPEEVKVSGSSHELSPWTWFIPISSLIMILGLIYEEVVLGKNELGLLPRKVDELEEETPATEATQLIQEKRVSKRRRSSVVEIKQRLSAQYEMDRRHSVEAVGIINPFETREERESSDELMKDKKAWEELAKLDASIEEEDD